MEQLGRYCGSLDLPLDSVAQARIAEGLPEDDGRTMYFPVCFHITYQDREDQLIRDDIAFELERINENFNGMCRYRGRNRDKYSGVLLEILDDYSSRSGSANIKFVGEEIYCRNMGKIVTTNPSLIDQRVKRQFPPNQQRINVWVIDTATQGLLGYAQFMSDQKRSTEGVVLARGTFGKRASYLGYDQGGTFTHEMGHLFCLRHTFDQNGAGSAQAIDYRPGEHPEELRGDCVVDTPIQSYATQGDPSETGDIPFTTIGDQRSYHMFPNFMDYPKDRAMHYFTKEQCRKMRLFALMFRPDLILREEDVPSQSAKPVTMELPVGIAELIQQLMAQFASN